MGKALYLVIFSRNEWWVDFEGRPFGPFGSRENAALEARALARFQSNAGRVSEVLVPDAEGKYWVIWSSAHTGADGKPFVPRRYGHKAG
jgi:hypothetical protein